MASCKMMVPDWFFLGIGRRRWRIWITVTYGQWYKTAYGSAIGQHMGSTCIQRPSSTFIINTLSAIKSVVPFHLSLAMLFLIFVYYLAQGTAIDANPVPSIYNQSIKPNSCKDITHCHTIWNIALLPSFRVLGLRYIPTSRVQGSDRRTVVLKDGN